ncbi:MAG TPA: methyltransferase domain-containing protein [bacterium]|nr:methyltransferase domain-containing protein [bacterium]HQL62560.1 methyltransferase domain-containing protein [bacterium]
MIRWTMFRNRGLNIDDPETTELRYEIVRRKKFLRKVYKEWYDAILAALPAGQGAVLELGSGAGFLRDYIPDLVTSDVIPSRQLDLIADGHHVPFSDSSLRAIVMVNVLHHIPRCRLFFAEATRTVRPGGMLLMVEPWVTPWSRFVFRRLHHEPFDPDAKAWEFPSTGPLSGANSALPWILFRRDRSRFEQEFPEWRLLKIEPCMSFRYLLSGGMSAPTISPAWTFGFWAKTERLFRQWIGECGLFAYIVLERIEGNGTDGMNGREERRKLKIKN